MFKEIYFMSSYLKKLLNSRARFIPRPTQWLGDSLGGRGCEVFVIRHLLTGRQVSSPVIFKSLEDLIGTLVLFFDNFARRQKVSEDSIWWRARQKMISGNQWWLGPSRSRRKTGGCTLAL
jgi:hypothetical protein